MENFDKEMLKELANQVMFDLSDEECDELHEEFETYLKQLNLLNKIDTEGVEEMIYPFETPTQFLRDDAHVETISQKEAMKNAPKENQNYIVVPKVVK